MDGNPNFFPQVRFSDERKKRRFSNFVPRSVGFGEREAQREKLIDNLVQFSSELNRKRQLRGPLYAGDTSLMRKQDFGFEMSRRNECDESQSGQHTDIMRTLLKQVESLKKQLAHEAQERATLQRTVGTLQQQLNALMNERQFQGRYASEADNVMDDNIIHAVKGPLRSVFDSIESEWSNKILSEVKKMIEAQRRKQEGRLAAKHRSQSFSLEPFHSLQVSPFIDKAQHHNKRSSDVYDENNRQCHDNDLANSFPSRDSPNAFTNFSVASNDEIECSILGDKNGVVEVLCDTQPLPGIRKNSPYNMSPGGILLRHSSNTPLSDCENGSERKLNPVTRKLNAKLSGAPTRLSFSSLRMHSKSPDLFCTLGPQKTKCRDLIVAKPSGDF
ncbi:protein kinase, putative [Trypanosoma cruzi marinkellei]|uniref:Protein kinase, putative n=1 Tax=Trypanosoma cruzi marinkellei TaxID=85056 RepID=K2ND57_TRYCR|nr:protein kinase, putative [Trypanosoma cruzi marinkellei]